MESEANMKEPCNLPDARICRDCGLPMTDEPIGALAHYTWKCRDLLIAKLKVQGERCEWQPIEVAPYGEWVLAWCYLPKNPIASGPVIAQRSWCEKDESDEISEPLRRTVGCWWANGMYYRAGHITHWMPLPMPPSSARDKPRDA